jgi:RNA polymerase Rpb8
MEMICRMPDLARQDIRSDCIYRQVFVSFGGLLLYIEGPYAKLNPLRIDYVYLLMKR